MSCQLEAIFEFISQADRTSDRANGGIGIGLSLVRSSIIGLPSLADHEVCRQLRAR